MIYIIRFTIYCTHDIPKPKTYGKNNDTRYTIYCTHDILNPKTCSRQKLPQPVENSHGPGVQRESCKEHRFSTILGKGVP